MEKFGEQFLHQRDPRFHISPALEKTQERRKARGEKTSQKPTEKIEAYLNRLKNILNPPDLSKKERNINMLKKSLHENAVIKPEDIPESYFNNQRRLAREQGYGDIEITPETRNQLAEVIINDQESTMDNWLDYFTSADSDSYPIWAKYWAFASMLQLSVYDKEKKAFGKRDKGTIAPFPDLNREALAYVVDAIVKKAGKENIAAEQDSPELKNIIREASFGKLYAYAIEKITPTEENELLNTKGKWLKYFQNSDHMPLVQSLQGHGTGWCTAGESTARTQLDGGDFYIYHSYGKGDTGQPTIPRVAIRMQGPSIAEVRGVANGQNLDPYIGKVVEDKLAEFPDGKAYQKKSEDMKRLTGLERKIKAGEKPSTDNLHFLYEIDSGIKGFGYEKDPRIEEIKSARDQKQDYAQIFGCKPKQVAFSINEMNSKTVVFSGDLYFRKSRPQELPAGLTHIGGSLDLRNSQLKELPAGLTHIGGSLDLENSQLQELPAGLTHIGGDLDLRNSQLKELPAGLTHIGGSLYLRNSQLKELPAGLTHIGESLNLENSQLKKLPAGLTHIGGSLYLGKSQPKELPAGLTHIGGSLYLRNSQLQELPASLTHIGGSLYLENSQLQKLPTNIQSIVKGKIIR